MTVDEFNDKWSNNLEEGYYGLAINHPKVIKYLDKEFEEEVKTNPNFTFSQIKTKWGYVNVYTDSPNRSKWENEITKLLYV